MDKSININFIIDLEKSLEGSGIHSSAIRLQKELIDSKFIVKINNREFAEIIHFHTALPMSFIKLYLIEKNRKDRNYPKIVIHGHTTVEDFIGSFALSNQLKQFLSWYLPQFYKRADHVIAVSKHNKNLLINYGVDPSKISVISNGIKIKDSNLDHLRRKTRKFLGLKDDQKLIIGLGVSIYRKGIDRFVDIAEQLPNHEFIWIGKRIPTPFMAHATYLKKKFKKANKLKNCRFPGYVTYKTLLALFSASDIFLFPTREENQGIAFLEAILYNKPAIISDHPVFEEYKDGIHVLKASDINSFVQKINMLSIDKNLEKKLIESSKAYLDVHSLTNTVTQLSEVYESLINEK